VHRWRVHKFGGSSVADAACMQRVADIVERETSARAGVVLSASRGVTDALLALITQAERQQPVDDAVHALRERHVEMARTLIPGTSADAYTEVLDRDCQDIAGILHAVHLTRSASSAVRDLVAGFGEIWSTRLFARYLAARGRRPGRVIWVDARDVVRVDWSALGPSVRWDESRAVSSREPQTVCRRRWGETGAIFRHRSSATCSTRKRLSSGPTSMVC